MRNYEGANEGAVRAEAGTGTGPLPEDQPGRPTTLQTFIIAPTGLFRTEALVAQLAGLSEVNLGAQGGQRRVIKYKYLKPSNEEAEKGAFPLLYPYGDYHDPFDMKTFLESKRRHNNDNEDEPSNNDNPNLCNLNALTWAKHTKRRVVYGQHSSQLWFTAPNVGTSNYDEY